MNKKHCTYIVILLISIILWGCVSIPSPYTKFPSEFMVKLENLPDGFEYNNSNYIDNENEQIFEVVYSKKDYSSGAFIKHEIRIFQDVGLAGDFYSDEIGIFKENAWKYPEDIKFVANNSTDKFNLSCMHEYINGIEGYGCNFTQLHENLVITIITHINDKNISFSDFEEILNTLDKKLPEEIIQFPYE